MRFTIFLFFLLFCTIGSSQSLYNKSYTFTNDCPSISVECDGLIQETLLLCQTRFKSSTNNSFSFTDGLRTTLTQYHQTPFPNASQAQQWLIDAQQDCGCGGTTDVIITPGDSITALIYYNDLEYIQSCDILPSGDEVVFYTKIVYDSEGDQIEVSFVDSNDNPYVLQGVQGECSVDVNLDPQDTIQVRLNSEDVINAVVEGYDVEYLASCDILPSGDEVGFYRRLIYNNEGSLVSVTIVDSDDNPYTLQGVEGSCSYDVNLNAEDTIQVRLNSEDVISAIVESYDVEYLASCDILPGGDEVGFYRRVVYNGEGNLVSVTIVDSDDNPYTLQGVEGSCSYDVNLNAEDTIQVRLNSEDTIQVRFSPEDTLNISCCPQVTKVDVCFEFDGEIYEGWEIESFDPATALTIELYVVDDDRTIMEDNYTIVDCDDDGNGGEPTLYEILAVDDPNGNIFPESYTYIPEGNSVTYQIYSDYCLPPDDGNGGILRGHFDADYSDGGIYPFGGGSTNAHNHEYDDDFDITYVDWFNPLGSLSGGGLPDILSPSQRFKILIVNADINTAGFISVNEPTFDQNDPSTYEVGQDYDNTLIANLPIYTLNGANGTTQLTSLYTGYFTDAVERGPNGILPTNTRDVRDNVAGRYGEWRNGAYTVQIVAVDALGNDLFTVDPSWSNGGQGAANTGNLLYEGTLFWHWDGSCTGDDSSYHEPTWQDDYDSLWNSNCSGDPGCESFQLCDVIVDGVSVGPVSSYTFTNVDQDHVIEGVFYPAGQCPEVACNPSSGAVWVCDASPGQYFHTQAQCITDCGSTCSSCDP